MDYVVTTANGGWLAVLLFCAAAKQLRHRERWIGWTEEQRRRRLGLVVNTARFLILPGKNIPNLALRALPLTLDRLSADWQECYGHPVDALHTQVETAHALVQEAGADGAPDSDTPPYPATGLFPRSEPGGQTQSADQPTPAGPRLRRRLRRGENGLSADQPGSRADECGAVAEVSTPVLGHCPPEADLPGMKNQRRGFLLVSARKPSL
jgi:hypothetical protein